MEFFYAVLVALALAACAGLRAFLPLFMLGLVARFSLPVPFASTDHILWLGTDMVLAVLFVLALTEVIFDAVPLLDNGLQFLYFGLRPLAGALGAFSVLDGSEEGFVVACLLAVLLAGLVTLPVHTVSTGVRVVSTTTTAGAANPLVSLKETVLSFFGTLFALFAAPLALLAAAIGAYSLYRYVRYRRELAAA